MKSNKRKAIVIVEEFEAFTFLKPFSDEYRDFLIMIYEDAYGEFSGRLEKISEIRKTYNGSDEEFEIFLKDLEK